MDFERIDINQCPKGKGNNGPNKFANTARCKTETTEVISVKKLLHVQYFSRNFLFSILIYIFLCSVNHYMVGVFEEEDISVDVSQVSGYQM